jgi:phosphomannomutase
VIHRNEQTVEYRCPGEPYPISRAVHLSRLGRFYPACRACPHRNDTGTLSARRVKRLVETRVRAEPRPLFDEEGAAGVYLNDLDPTTARRLAVALGIFVRRERTDADEPPVMVIAGDGRPLAPELVAAVAEGLRWTGSHVVDIGEATAGCTAFAIDHLGADGGILVGNPGAGPQTVGLKFWARGGRPLSAGGPLEALEEIFLAGADITVAQPPSAVADRPTRSFGSLRRLQVEDLYLAGMAEHYHALRPLRVVLAGASRPMLGYLDKLTERFACRVVPVGGSGEQLAQQILAEQAHLAACIGDDGQTCRLLDERGHDVHEARLLLLVARHLLGQHPGGAIVLEEGTPAVVAERLKALGGRVLAGGTRRAEMYRAMGSARAVLGGGGRLWHPVGGTFAADALMSLTLVLEILSRSDRPVSEVLDADAAMS